MKKSLALSPLSRDEREIVDFAAIWIPYDGPTAPDIFIRFGIPAALFHHRLQHILTLHTCVDLSISSELHRQLSRYLSATKSIPSHV
ncbi:hypothetical protein ACIBM3_28115 [Rhodococcus erythropolis]|uniref:hypothetical protein n=1 Tax=Rhodococcus erythropolis TaxID=1833 RepID=UPI0037A6006E